MQVPFLQRGAKGAARMLKWGGTAESPDFVPGCPVEHGIRVFCFLEVQR